MSHSWQDDLLRSAVAAKKIGNDDARPTLTSFQELSEKPHRRKSIAFRLDQNVDHSAVLIDCTPKIILHAVDLEEDLVEKPFVAQFRLSSFQLGSLGSSEVLAPTADRLVTQVDSSIGHHQFHFAQTHRKIEV